MKRKSLLLLLLAATLMPLAMNAQITLFSEDFEGGSGSIPSGWTQSDGGTWSVGSGDYSSSTGAGQGIYNALITHGTTGNVTKLITPTINLASASSPELSFMHVQRSWAGDVDKLNVYYRTSTNGSWTQLLSYTDAVASWTTESGISLPNPSSTYQLAFEMTDNYGYGVGLDDIKITQYTSCANPTNLTYTLTPGYGTIANLSWTESGSATSWVVEYATNSSFTGALTKNVNGTPTTQLTGLTPETTYYAHVKADCGDGEQSGYSSTVSFMPTNAYQITLNNGTTTNTHVPFYGFYADMGTHSQFILPASSLTELQFGTINKLTFYSSNASVSWTNIAFSVYMTEVDNTSFSSSTLLNWSSMTRVYSGSVRVNNNMMEIMLDTPFDYENGNLLIGFNETTNSSDYPSVTWLGVSQSANTAIYAYGSSSQGFETFLPKVTIDYVPGSQSSCPRPASLAVTNNGETATATWVGTADSYNIDINGNVINNVTSPYTFNVELATSYSVKVQANCDDDTSDWSAAYTFTTNRCLAVDMCEITFVLTDSYGDSWNGNAIQVKDVETGNIWQFTNENLDGQSGGTEETQTYTLDVCNGSTLEFSWISGSYLSETSFTVTDINDDVIVEGSGESFDTFNYTVSCSGCKKPKNLTVSNITTESATLSWEGTSDSYQVQCIPWSQVGQDVVATNVLTTYEFPLNEYSGFGSIAIRHYNVTDMFWLNIDDIVVTNAYGETVFTEDFEGGSIPASFSNLDMDGDGYKWEMRDSYEDANGNPVINGDYGVTSASYTRDTGPLTPDNWLIIPNVELGGTLTLVARGQDADNAAENFGVYIYAEDFGEIVDVDGTSYEAPYLMSNTVYSWRVRGVCDDGESSWANSPSTFTTSDYTMTFVTSGNWDNPNNWEPNGIPDFSYSVKIAANATIPADVVAEARRVDINSGSITIKEGGQLKQGAATLKVTMEKTINGVGTNNWTPDDHSGYYFIASPFNGRTELYPTTTWSCVSNIIDGDYDLYGFDPSQENEEWVNYKSSSSHPIFHNDWGSERTGLQWGEGYLYANATTHLLTFTGTTWSSYGNVMTKDFDYDPQASYRWKGWRLVGNVYTCDCYLNYIDADGFVQEANFYVMNEDGDGYVLSSSNVGLPPLTGAFINVRIDGKVQYASEAPYFKETGLLHLDLCRGNKTIDQARLRFGEGYNLDKMNFRENSSKLYITQDNIDYAVVYTEAQGEMPVSFKAAENGSYTLNFSNEEVEFGYLHLIDNMTGKDVDLLQTPSYTFEARTTDYASRFKLVFATGDNSNEANFAFFSNGSFVINNEGDATLQVIDLTGRILKSESINGCASINMNAAQGIYMLRLVNGENVKVQKVVVR